MEQPYFRKTDNIFSQGWNWSSLVGLISSSSQYQINMLQAVPELNVSNCYWKTGVNTPKNGHESQTNNYAILSSGVTWNFVAIIVK